MKINKLFLGIFLGATTLVSCDMNNVPDGVIDLDKGMISDADVTAARIGQYSFLRSRAGGSYVVTRDLQSDLFIGTMQNGNSYLAFTTGNIQSDDSDIEGVWAGFYSGLAQVNYFIEETTKYLNNNELSEAFENEVTNCYLPEAYFMRAYYNYRLMDYFCGAYNASTATDEATGIPLVTRFYPSGDRDAYPGRSTLAETYTAIENDLTAAYNGLAKYEETNKTALAPGSGYINSYAVEALQARVALLKGDYKTAYDKSSDIISSELFPLTEYAAYVDMWINDNGDELIFQPFGNSDQLGSVPATGTLFNQVNPVNVKFAPSAALIAAYDDADVRLEAFIGDIQVDYNGSRIWTPQFTKYPGNPSFNTGNTTAFKNLPKTFRTSEQYLILAEAANALGKDEDARKALNTLRAARIADYTDVDYSGNVLRDQIRLERVKELAGEGFRISDLRRWGLGFTRDGGYNTEFYPDMSTYIINLATNVVYIPGDHRYVWPIPSYEMTTNPQLVGFQNPGY